MNPKGVDVFDSGDHCFLKFHSKEKKILVGVFLLFEVILPS